LGYQSLILIDIIFQYELKYSYFAISTSFLKICKQFANKSFSGGFKELPL